MSPEEWAKEMVGIRKMIGQFANIPPCEVKGIKSKTRVFIIFQTFQEQEHHSYRWVETKCLKCCMTTTFSMIVPGQQEDLAMLMQNMGYTPTHLITKPSKTVQLNPALNVHGKECGNSQ